MSINPFKNFRNLGTINSNSEEYEHSVDIEAKDILEEKDEESTFPFFYFITVILVLILTIRLLDLQIAQGTQHRYLAEGNRLRSRDLPAPRGNIYDQNSNQLATNMASYNFEIFPADLPKDQAEREKIYDLIEEYTTFSKTDITSKVGEKGLYNLDPIILEENVDRDKAMLWEIYFKDISGVIINKKPIRKYLADSGLAHILGYTGKITQEELDSNQDYKITNDFGKSGIEQIYESQLKGTDGMQQMEVDSLGRLQRMLAVKSPLPGNNLYLTINLNLQKNMEKFLSEESRSLGGKNAVALAINPQTGGILGMVSLPYYDNNIFQSSNRNAEYQKLLDDPNTPLINRAISGVYPSGSTIKPMIAAAGLESNVITGNTKLDTSIGVIRIGEWSFPDWKVHGVTDVRQAIAESNDIFFYAVGGGWDKINGLGVNKIDEYLTKFGFGAKSKIDLSGESYGLVPTPDWKKKVKNDSWYIGDTYHLAIGQGDFLTTPLQLANAISSIANGGKLLQPHLLDKITDSAGKLLSEFPTKIVREKFISDNNIQIVREGMRQAVLSGSARQLNTLNVTSAGKTGTAQFGSGQETHSWFVAFAPYDNPQIVLVVLVEGGGEGNSTAVPVAKQILESYFNK